MKAILAVNVIGYSRLKALLRIADGPAMGKSSSTR